MSAARTSAVEVIDQLRDLEVAMLTRLAALRTVREEWEATVAVERRRSLRVVQGDRAGRPVIADDGSGGRRLRLVSGEERGDR